LVGAWEGNKSLFTSFSSEKEESCSFSEEKEAKRLLFLRCCGHGDSPCHRHTAPLRIAA
jgi:hypothetical protein